MLFRLLVIDGADTGTFFRLPASGTVRIGNHQNQTGICLHDLLVARAHCDLVIADGLVTANALPTPNGTRLGGKPLISQALAPGDILHLGNTHMRLECSDHPDAWGPGEPVPVPPPPGSIPKLDAGSLDKLSGQKLAHFELANVLGRGHTGITFRAKDLKNGQEVALKVLDPEFPHSDEEMQHFVRALKKRNGLHHPRLVTLHGAGKAGPYCWISQELIDGESVGRAIEKQAAGKKVRWRKALNLALDIGRALAYLHEHRIRHGNLTPNNMLVHSANESTKLNDVLHTEAFAGSALAKKSAEKKLQAEVAYLSPEQADPSNRWVDDLSDLYSLGVAVYALLVGKPPFTGDTVKETLRHIRDEQPAKPRMVNKLIPDEFQSVVLKMLAKHPEERYPTAAALVTELERIANRHAD